MITYNLHDILFRHVTENAYMERFEGSKKISVEVATNSSIKEVTDLIHISFKVWKFYGLDLSPMTQTINETEKHLINKGLVFKDQDKNLVATVSFEIGSINLEDNCYLLDLGEANPTKYNKIDSDLVIDQQVLIFKKLAVHPNFARKGIGKSIFQSIEKLAVSNKFNGICLETVKEATWLYDWYLLEGFKPIGTFNYPSRPLSTVLMYKLIGTQNG